MDQTAGGILPGRLSPDVIKALQPVQGPLDGARVSMDSGGDRVIAGPAAGIGPGEVEEGRQHPQVGRREPGVSDDVVREGGEGDTSLALGPWERTRSLS